MNPSTPAPNLTELLASMDRVDQARTKEDLIAEALNLPDRKAALAQKLRDTYAQQGIEVTDEAIRQGVDAHYAGRHAFQPLSKGPSWVMAHAWVKRKLIATLGFIAIATVVILMVLVGVIKNAGQRMREREAAEAVAAEQARVAKVEADKVAAAEAQKRRAIQQQEAQAARDRALGALPDQISALGKAINGVAKEETVRARVAVSVVTGLGLAKAGDLEGATASYRELTDTLSQLNLEYEVRINLSGTKPNGQTVDGRKWVTGGWRDYRGSKRYYVVVNAVTTQGSPVTVPVRNSETGSIDKVSSWAEEVPQAVYERLKAEKQTKGNVANTLFGAKSKGYMEPLYHMGYKAAPTVQSNAADHRITRW